MKLKKALSGILCMAMICLLLPVMPQSGEAATVGSIEPVKVGDSRIVVNLNDAKEGDNFEVRVNGVKVNSGDLYSEDGAYKQMYFGLGPGYKAKAGDKIQFLIEDANGAFGPAAEVSVADNREAKLPTSMTAASSTVQASDNASVKLNFDKDFVAGTDDKIRVTPFDSKDTKLEAYEMPIPAGASDSVVVQLTNSAKTAYYVIEFVPGNGEPSPVNSLKITVTEGSGGEGGDSGDQQDILDKAVDMIFVYPSTSVSLGESVTPTIKLVDAEGKQTVYTGSEAIFSYSGEAVSEGTFDSKGRFTVSSNQKLEGSKIQVTCMLHSFSKTVELTVQKSDKSLLLTPGTAGCGASRSVTFQLANGSGDRLYLLWKPTVAQVVMKTVDGTNAKLAGTVTDISNITSTGEGKLLISSDVPAEVEITLILRDNDGHFYETGISKFKFTEEGADAVKVVLNIGSYNYSVNGVYKTTDTKPVIMNNRTFVPFRLLAETLGGCEVKYDQTTKTVTATDGTTNIVMTVGSKEYTVNGVKKTMDVAPFANSDYRTMVPLRVLAESFGCTVEPVKDAQGNISVVFERK
ncbi:MAG: copper amine oxidase N-terminal domain-containing protein [Peptococcaceae bacterium]|nr:copper amine oxidase N-terminal domain-containing protein [Peptococcaceae bacterium]